MAKKIATQRRNENGDIVFEDHLRGTTTMLAKKIDSMPFLIATLNAYTDYATSTVTRNIPRVEDGLKLVTRRLLHELRTFTTNTKSAKIIGNVLGGLHP